MKSRLWRLTWNKLIDQFSLSFFSYIDIDSWYSSMVRELSFFIFFILYIFLTKKIRYKWQKINVLLNLTPSDYHRDISMIRTMAILVTAYIILCVNIQLISSTIKAPFCFKNVQYIDSLRSKMPIMWKL